VIPSSLSLAVSLLKVAHSACRSLHLKVLVHGVLVLILGAGSRTILSVGGANCLDTLAVWLCHPVLEAQFCRQWSDATAWVTLSLCGVRFADKNSLSGGPSAGDTTSRSSIACPSCSKMDDMGLHPEMAAPLFLFLFFLFS
jgi:hypothetical protein